MWPITAHGQIREPETQAGREKACGQECMYATTSCPRRRMGLEYQHSSRRIRHRTNMKHTHTRRHALQHAHTHTHLQAGVWIRHMDSPTLRLREFLRFQLTSAEESLKSTASAKGYSERLDWDQTSPPPPQSFIESTCMQTLLCRGSLNEPHI